MAKARRIKQINLVASLGKGGGCNLLHSEGLKNSLDIESKLFLALSVFCSGAVPLYSSHSQNTKFISLSQSLPACRNLLFSYFYTLKQCRKSQIVNFYTVFLVYSSSSAFGYFKSSLVQSLITSRKAFDSSLACGRLWSRQLPHSFGDAPGITPQ